MRWRAPAPQDSAPDRVRQDPGPAPPGSVPDRARRDPDPAPPALPRIVLGKIRLLLSKDSDRIVLGEIWVQLRGARSRSLLSEIQVRLCRLGSGLAAQPVRISGTGESGAGAADRAVVRLPRSGHPLDRTLRVQEARWRRIGRRWPAPVRLRSAVRRPPRGGTEAPPGRPGAGAGAGAGAGRRFPPRTGRGSPHSETCAGPAGRPRVSLSSHLFAPDEADEIPPPGSWLSRGKSEYAVCPGRRENIVENLKL